MSPAAKTFISMSSGRCTHNAQFYEPMVDCGECMGALFDNQLAEAIEAAKREERAKIDEEKARAQALAAAVKWHCEFSDCTSYLNLEKALEEYEGKK